MIKFKIDERIILTFNSVDGEIFNRCVSMAKLFKLRFSAKEKYWICSAGKFEPVLDAFRDIGIVEVEPEDYESRLVELLSPKKELQYKPERITPDYDLMNFPPFKGKHENFQHIDIKNALQRNRYGLFLDMGLGKSYELATILAHYMLKWKKVNKVLVLSSNTGVRNLPDEFEKFIKGFDKLRHTTASKDNRKPFNEDNDIVFSSYNTFRLISKAYQKTNSSKPRKAFIPFREWFGKEGDGLILMDESHQAANPDSQQGNFIAIHAPDFKYRYLATGTPADKPEKLYNQLKIMDRSLVHGFSFSEWKEFYAELGNRFSAAAITGWQKEKMVALNQRMQEYCVFRKTEDTIDLPENIEKPVYCTLGKRHQKIYESFVQTTMDENRYEGGQGFNVSKIVNLFPYLTLSLHNPKLLEKHFEKFDTGLIKNVDSFNYARESDALEALKGVIDDHKDEKGIIWVVHPSTAELLREIFKSKNPLVMTGATKESGRRGIVDNFRESPKHKLLIANIMVLSTSYTITEAKWQFYLERNYDYTSYSQSKKRIHRIGQDQNVRTYYAVYKDTIDIFLDANLKNKGTLVEGLVSKKFLTKAEWSRIFNPKSVRY